jgi:hypothetical protein
VEMMNALFSKSLNIRTKKCINQYSNIFSFSTLTIPYYTSSHFPPQSGLKSFKTTFCKKNVFWRLIHLPFPSLHCLLAVEALKLSVVISSAKTAFFDYQLWSQVAHT